MYKDGKENTAPLLVKEAVLLEVMVVKQ